MKKRWLIVVLGCCIMPVWGEDTVSSSISVSEAMAAPQVPQSNIDLLKRSLQTSGAKGAVVGAGSVKNTSASSDKKASSSTTKPASSAENAVAASPQASSTQVLQPALPPAPEAAKPDPAPKRTAVSSTTLEIPLEVGGKTQTVQTTVSPKQLSPSAAKRVEAAKAKREKNASADKAASGAKAGSLTSGQETELEKNIEKENALLPPSEKQAAGSTSEELSSEEVAADAELEYAVKMLEKSKAKAEATTRPIPPSAAKNVPNKVPAPNKKFDPNAFRPGVTWLESKSNHFDIYTQKRTSGIPSANMSMTFENAHQTLRRFIPWMMSNRVRVFIYQDHDSYLRHEPHAKAWTRALAYPTRGEIVVYDEPGHQRELQEVFTHELTHIFTQQFFDSHKTGRIMTPTWLDEGLAVFMEDQAAGPKGGPWSQDLKRLNIRRDPSKMPPSFKTTSMFGSSFGNKLGTKKRGKPVILVPFEEFVNEGSLQAAEGSDKVQDWYFQAYAMVRFLLNPAGGTSPSNRMQFEQFTRLVAQGEAKRDPATGFLVKDAKGNNVYETYSVEKALGRAYHYNTISTFEDNFWRWIDNQ